MPHILILSDAALADLRAIQEMFSGPYAGVPSRLKRQAVRNAVLDLRSHPWRWRRSDEHEGFRVRTVAGCAIIYRVDPPAQQDDVRARIEIVRIFAVGRDQSQL